MVTLTQQQIERVHDYQSLTEVLSEVFYPMGKPEIADKIGISPKQFYRILAGDKSGVYSHRKIGNFLMKNLGFTVKETKSGIKLSAIPNFIFNDNATFSYDKRFVDYLLEDNRVLKQENLELREELNSLRKEFDKVRLERMEK